MSDEPIPGWVEVRFTDAAGRKWSVFDKPPVFDELDVLRPDSSYPVDVTIACVVLGERDGLVTVSTTPHHVETPDGRDEFVVRREQLVG
ncbi:hypothetical protein ACH4PU_01320 [Streptomyces sp. NPDC021100]|uniref:hypothetical protein n=1 Tax=Streptomyces sp. NPDC021100 TaxID=3365114 RepID=UPI0037A7F974